MQDPTFIYTPVQFVVAGEVHAPESLYQVSEGTGRQARVIGYTLKTGCKCWLTAQHCGDLYPGSNGSFCCRTRKDAAMMLYCKA